MVEVLAKPTPSNLSRSRALHRKVLGKGGILVSPSPNHTKAFPLFWCGGVFETGNERLISPLKIHAA